MLTEPMANLTKLLGTTYLVGKMTSLDFNFRILWLSKYSYLRCWD